MYVKVVAFLGRHDHEYFKKLTFLYSPRPAADSLDFGRFAPTIGARTPQTTTGKA
jgi:hypothetical protein